MKFYSFFLFILLTAFNVNAQTCDPSQMVLYQVRANETDSDIGWELNRHHAFFNPSCTPRNTLVVHLVGSFDNPNSTLKFPSLAANNGFHVVSLKYPNGTAAQSACGTSSNPDCYINFRREILEGINLSSDVNVNADESVYNRLVKLLLFLNIEHPGDNWGQFVSNNETSWGKVIVSGHSQGGGHAAVIALTKPVKRVLMFAAPNDYSEFSNGPAPWTLDSHAAADSAYFGFNNTHDDVVNFSEQFQAWSNMGLPTFGDSVKVDGANLPYNYSHQLYTNYDTTGIGGDHSVMILDSKTPVDNFGQPKFAPVWEYMLGLHGGPNSITENQGSKNTISVYPNPTSGLIQIKFDNVSKGELRIFDAFGRMVYSEFLSGSQVQVDLQHLRSGVYFIKLYDDGVDVGGKRVTIVGE